MVKETRFALGYSLKLFRSHSTILKRTVGTGDRSSLIFIFSPRIIDYDIIVGGRKEKKKKNERTIIQSFRLPVGISRVTWTLNGFQGGNRVSRGSHL